MSNVDLEERASTLRFDNPSLANQLFGPGNMNLMTLAECSGLTISSRGTALRLDGDAGARSRMSNLLTQAYGLLKYGVVLHPRDLEYAYAALERNPASELKTLFQDTVFIASPRRTITPKTLNQREYVAALRSSEMTFAIGPAGTGKTYLAVAMALSFLHAKRVKRLILTRPAVEAGERLGFLPGDMAQKVDPYLRPLYDALHDMLDFERVSEMLATGIIEVAPLAFMRGRTLTDAYIIMDEAQNTTVEQMKMFLTRMGFGSRVAVTGDITQIDLPNLNGRPRSGLVHALSVLDGLEGISIRHFHQQDVLRHPLVGRIVSAYDAHEKYS
ncbi:MAG: PhoH family protein [Desulfovibrio sp.]|jgi:phosphate starvation-inducible PhoH-like protein|nr:PhoH family protein [Desulfovibrio sp.]